MFEFAKSFGGMKTLVKGVTTSSLFPLYQRALSGVARFDLLRDKQPGSLSVHLEEVSARLM